MSVTYKMVKRIYHEIEFTDDDFGEGKPLLTTQAVERCRQQENDNPMELLQDGDEWEVESTYGETDEAY